MNKSEAVKKLEKYLIENDMINYSDFYLEKDHPDICQAAQILKFLENEIKMMPPF